MIKTTKTVTVGHLGHYVGHLWGGRFFDVNPFNTKHLSFVGHLGHLFKRGMENNEVKTFVKRRSGLKMAKIVPHVPHGGVA